MKPKPLTHLGTDVGVRAPAVITRHEALGGGKRRNCPLKEVGDGKRRTADHVTPPMADGAAGKTLMSGQKA